MTGQKPSSHNLFQPRLVRMAHFGSGGGLFVSLFLSLFGGILFQERQIAFRDAEYFYHPLYRYIHEAVVSGRLPLWDPYENLGQPLAANPVAAVFYPGKLIFFLKEAIHCSYGFCFKTYVLAHLAAAFFFLYILVRSPLPYAEGGWIPAATRGVEPSPLLSRTGAQGGWFQVTNVVFLVGAAWLPLLLAYGLRIAHAPGVRSMLGFALVLFMMVSGGDPQTAYLGTLVSLVLVLMARPRYLPSNSFHGFGGTEGGLSPKSVSICFYFRPRVMCLLGALALAFALSAVQIFPTAELAVRSSRIGGGSILPACQFSVAPWRCLEFFWPNIGGREFPENSRWFSSLPNDTQVWTPSLYMGLYPALLAVLALLPSRRAPLSLDGIIHNRRIETVLAWLAALSILASFGGFGLGWLLRIAFHADGISEWRFQEGDPSWGVYWILAQILPGYSAFRYPAKAMTFGTLAIAILAGLGWDRLQCAICGKPLGKSSGMVFRKRPGLSIGESIHVPYVPSALWGLRGATAILFILSACGILWGYLGNPAETLSRLVGTDLFASRTIYGKCDPALVAVCVRNSLFQTGALSAVLCFMAFLLPHCHSRQIQWGWQSVFFLIVCADLYAAQRWMVAGVPEPAYEVASPLASRIHHGGGAESPPPRIFRDPFLYPPLFWERTSPARLVERVVWDRLTLFQKVSMLEGISNMDMRGTFVLADYLEVSNYLRSSLAGMKKAPQRSTGKMPGMPKGMRSLLASLGTEYAIVPQFLVGTLRSESEGSGAGGKSDESERLPGGVALMEVPDASYAWIVHADKGGLPETWRGLVRGDMHNGAGETEKAVVSNYRPERIEMEVSLAEPATIVLAEQYYPGWTAFLASGDGGKVGIPVRKIASCLRGVDLPVGDSRLVMEYRPLSVTLGGGVSASAWLGCLAWLLWGFLRKCRGGNRQRKG